MNRVGNTEINQLSEFFATWEKSTAACTTHQNTSERPRKIGSNFRQTDPFKPPLAFFVDFYP